MVTELEIEALKSAKGGWTRKTLKSLGVPWPPPKGWKRALLAGRKVKRKNKNAHNKSPKPIPTGHKPSSRIDHPPAKFTTQDNMLQTLPPGLACWTVPPWEYEPEDPPESPESPSPEDFFLYHGL